MMRIADVMRKNVVTVTEEQKLKDVAKTMDRHGIGCVVVVRDEKPVGIITEADVIKTVAKGKDPLKVTARSIMARPVITGVEGLDLDDAVKLMVLHNIKKLPIVKEDELVGIVTLTDFARYEPLLHDMMKKALKAASVATRQKFEKVLVAKEPPGGMYG